MARRPLRGARRSRRLRASGSQPACSSQRASTGRGAVAPPTPPSTPSVPASRAGPCAGRTLTASESAANGLRGHTRAARARRIGAGLSSPREGSSSRHLVAADGGGVNSSSARARGSIATRAGRSHSSRTRHSFLRSAIQLSRGVPRRASRRQELRHTRSGSVPRGTESSSAIGSNTTGALVSTRCGSSSPARRNANTSSSGARPVITSRPSCT